MADKYVNNIMQCSNSNEREFVMSPHAMGDCNLAIKFASPERKAKLMGDLEMGGVSDAYILWALAIFELATPETVEMFLGALKNSNKELYIPEGFISSSKATKSPIAFRLEELYKKALIFRKVYPSSDPAKTGIKYVPTDDALVNLDAMQEEDPSKIIIYGPMPETTSIMNRVIEKRLPIRPSIYATSPRMCFAKAASAYAAANVASRITARLTGVREEAFKTKELGAVELPPVLKFDESATEKYNVCFYPAFLGQMSGYQTQMDHQAQMKAKCDEITNFLYTMVKDGESKPNSRKTYVVVVCESSDDIETFRALCQSYQRVVSYGNIERIYITSEGALRMIPDITKSFLKMRKDEEGYLETYLETPPFVKSKKNIGSY